MKLKKNQLKNSEQGHAVTSSVCSPMAWNFRRPAKWRRLYGAQQGGPVMGLRPLLGPPCIPPEAPPKKTFNFRKVSRARGLSCGSFLPSLCSLRRSPSAPRKCHSPLLLWAKSALAGYHNWCYPMKTAC